MKKLLLTITALVTFLLTVGFAQAYEGEIDLSGNNVSCKGSSVWRESRYRVIGRCEGLVYPFETQYEYYSIWAHDVSRDTYVRLDDIDRGYFEGDINSAFDKLLISAEQDGAPRRPSEKVVANGSVTKFAFDKSEVVVAQPIASDNAATNKTMTVQTTETTKATTTASSGSVVGRIITSLLVIILVVVGVVIAGSLLFRSRGSVSA